MKLRIRMTNFQDHVELIDEANNVVALVLCKQPVGPDDPGPWQDKAAEKLAMLFRSASELQAALQTMVWQHSPRSHNDMVAEEAAKEALNRSGINL